MVGVRYAMRKAKLCDKISVFIARLSKYSFGTYLVHLLVMDWVMNHILKVTSFPAILSVPVIALITFTLSTLISFVISKIPFFNRFAV
jgi:surface polysaccharide O-acyltransferase-like enzyme